MDQTFIKSVTRVVLFAFLYSFVVHDPAYAVVTLAKENNDAQKIVNAMESPSLPVKYGRVSDGYCALGNENGKLGSGNDAGESKKQRWETSQQTLQFPASQLMYNPSRLVVLIQDLHCNPTVQRNISDIVKYFDTHNNLKSIYVEGAPRGPLDITPLTGIADKDIKQRSLDRLLNAGVLSGAVYYAATVNKQDVFGLEDDALYQQNLLRIRRLLARQDEFTDTTLSFNRMMRAVKARFVSSELRAWDSKLRDSSETKRYKAIEAAAKKTGISLYLYPNLQRMLAQRYFSKKISFKKLPNQLRDYLSDLKQTVPFSVYNALNQKLEGGATDSEYYLALGEVGRQYAPQLARRHAEVTKFLAYVELTFSINPMSLVAEERDFTRRALDALAKSKADSDVLFLEDMAKMLSSFAELGITPPRTMPSSKPTLINSPP
jgi:hypothetical protein